MSLLNNIVDPEALLYALADQEQPLPTAVQRSLREVGDRLTQAEPDAANTLNQIIKQYPSLDQAYRKALVSLDDNYQAQRLTKGLTIALKGTSRNSLEQVLIQLLQQIDDIPQQARQLVSNPAKALAERHQLTIFKALDKQPQTLENLVYFIHLPIDLVTTIVQQLWQDGYLAPLKSSFMSMLFPTPKRQQPQRFDPTTYLTLTTKGYFSLHPLITPSRRKRA